MLHSQVNSPAYHEQQHQHQHQHQHQYQREDLEYQSSPPTSSHRAMNPYTHQSNNAMGATNNNTHYKSHSSQQQQQHMHAHQQQQQQHPHHRHQHNSYVQQAYQSSQIHLPHYASAKREDHHTTQQHSIPVIESSDPSFSQRPHSRSFSSVHSHPQYQPSNPPHYPPPQQHQQHPPQHQHQHQPRLHHSVSAGHLNAAGHRSTTIVGNTGYVVPKQGTGTVVAPKKKDPYATAWRTYSKIAEELNLLNPDGSLYPISKEAILKYLRHQSKRIKASNLHWYVNGLKKHQENLGFSWDDVRYDEQVLALLKELTLHPAPIENNGVSHQYYKTSLSGPIDTARIASLSISDAPHSKHFSQQQHQQQQQPPPPQQQQQQPFQQPSSHQAQFTMGAKRQPSHPQQYDEPSSQQQSRQYHQYPSQRTQPQPPSTTRAAPYHSAPVQLPSQHVQDEQMLPKSSLHRHRSHSNAMSRAHAPQSTSSGLDPQSAHPVASNGSNIKRKRHELGSERMAHIGSPASAEGEPYEDSEIGSRAVDQDDRDSQNVEDMEEEDPCERVALKRHASTGTLRSQARAMSIISSDAHPMPRQDIRRREFPTSTPSPNARENEVGGGSHFRWGTSETVQSRLSPPGSVSSVGSNSPVIRHAQGGSILSSQRHRRANGVVSSPISTAVAAVAAAATSTAAANGGTHASAMTPPPAVPNKNTVQFSEVVEYAQQLQTKYGTRCKDHPWGCVELTEDHHIELTIKMYMDWAGLVASGRLTMDELPDLPEFKRADVVRQDGSSPYSSPLSTSPSSSSSPVPSSTIGGTLKRMTSSPLTTSFSSFSLSQQQQQRQRQLSGSSSSFGFKTEDPSSPIDSPDSTSRFTFGGQNHSPSYSPAPFGESLMSRLGSPPPLHGSHRGKTMSPDDGGVDDLVSAGGNHAISSSSSSYVSKIRARKIASSPSLGQHTSFHLKQRIYSGSGPSSPPPVPALPASLLHSDMHISEKNGHARSIMSNSTASPPPSEEMDLSADEDMNSRTRIAMADQERHHSGRDRVLERGSEGGEMGDTDMEEDMLQENIRFRRNNRLHEEETDYDDDQWQRRESSEGKHRQWNVYSDYRNGRVEGKDELEERDQEGAAQENGGRDEEETHRVRMKSLERSSSPSRRDANGLMNSDPISTVAMDMMPNQQPRSQQQQQQQQQHNHRAHSPQQRSSRHEQAMESPEDIAMMET
ncbi:hypothetical protein BGZ50_008483 [Haplosporangium sp. Z 11]|nr:hypothetical protein BGZ50_008483 [Haplosporangium sp. Z 11]